ncbi:enhancer of polycomb-like protein [Trichophyton mentagrophytes]|uniref:Enhancer of polycomb-like protein n=1 Tax=Trichophyton interdigitale TaxID=101480 RepID=A0A9P5CY62_9EURO|nr:Enhancer of polycomb-like protein [Trichophyton interdigitale]KAF3897661.1 Enhancer of polycomb-like protein [Trichophyton interdigitale]GBF63333.1 enhancer of polycomb-like protein [Trichophyton mentagrophytes]
MSRLGGMMRATRPKKLTPKQPIPIFREDQIDLTEDDPQTTLQSIETGVEKAEETEFHLQAAINATAFGNAAQTHIPTPETVQSSVQYDTLYRPVFSQPATYIRFSSTVEDCSGCGYNLVEEDDVALKIMNQKRDASTQCTENQFEEVMSFFEETAQAKQPFAAVDNPPVVSYPEMEECFDGMIHDKLRPFFETGQDTDDGDPYVCFRRREVRLARKTRGRDAQSAEKLRRLRKELEDARTLIAMVQQRELGRKEVFAAERQLFMQRCEVKEMKRKLGIKDDDEDLINQKPKKKPTEVPVIQRPNVPQLRVPSRSTGQLGEDLQLLEDVQADKENDILREIKQNVAKHAKWNEGYVDITRAPLTPTTPQGFEAEFRPAITHEYLPTPPTSETSERMRDIPSGPSLETQWSALRQSSPSEDDSCRPTPSFRRRVGRGGRVLIDRRNLSLRNKDGVDPIKLDRFKYDRDDDDMDIVYEKDEFDIQIMQHRAYLSAKARDQAITQAQLQAQAQAHGQQVPSGRRLPGAPPTPGHNNVNPNSSNITQKA